jgi:hypothetical protein
MRRLLSLPLLALTSGCVAAAIPVLAGGVLARKELAGPASAPAPAPAPTATSASLPPVVTLPAEAADEAAPASPEPLTAELPASIATEPAASPAAAPQPVPALSIGAPAAGGVSAFAAFVTAAATAPPSFGPPSSGAARLSVLIDAESLISGPKRLACAAQPLAVAINLDPGTAKLDLNDPPAAAPGLAEALSAIRSAGVRVFWTSALPVDKADRVYAILRATGLDLDGTDRLLLVRKAGETVQQRRLAAARDWCFVALAGDRPGDFEEALDFLRDPDGPTARAMQPLTGNGWFVIPDPIA